MSPERENLLSRTLLELLPELENVSYYFPEWDLKSTPGRFEFEHKKNISRAMLDETKFTEKQKEKHFKVVDFLEEKYEKNDGSFLFRTKELNAITGKPEPKVNHCLKVSDRFILFILAGWSTMTEVDRKQDTQKYQDLLKVEEEYLYVGTIAALLHDVIEDGLATEEEVGELLDSINVTSANKRRILKIVDFLTIREEAGEPVNAYFDRIENSVSEFGIAAILAKLIKICDIEANAESEHTDKQRMKYGRHYIKFLIKRFAWVNALFPKWMNEKILEENEYLGKVADNVRLETRNVTGDSV